MSDAFGTMQIDPAEVRFTQDSIALYFQPPHQYFSIREAVKRISRNEMRPEDFPAIRVIRYGGFYWSIDNRRLWVFRYARCSSIRTVQTTRMHPRLEDIIANSCLFHDMKGVDFFPRDRDKGMKDWHFDLCFPRPSSFVDHHHSTKSTSRAANGLFPQPSSFVQRPRDDHSTKLPNTIGVPNHKAEEHSMKPPMKPLSGVTNEKPKAKSWFGWLIDLILGS